MPKTIILERRDIDKLIKARKRIKNVLYLNSNLNIIDRDYLKNIVYQLNDRIEYHEEKLEELKNENNS